MVQTGKKRTKKHSRKKRQGHQQKRNPSSRMGNTHVIIYVCSERTEVAVVELQ